MDLADLWARVPGYLNTASHGLPPRPVVDATTHAIRDWQHGSLAWDTWDGAVRNARATFARLVRVDAADVSVGATTSELLGHVADSVPSGSRILVAEEEFTSNLFPWLAQADRGVQVDVVPLAGLAESVDARTGLVAFSLVQSASGEVSPAEEIRQAAREHGALVAVDAAQACGWLPVDARDFDVLVCHSYKWLMAPRGAAFLVTTSAVRERMRPSAAGWYAGDGDAMYGPPLRLAPDARAFDTSPAWFSWVGTAAALEVVERLGVEAIHDHDVALANRLREGLGMPPGDSPIVSLPDPAAAERLERAGLTIGVRAGRARLSFHLYSTEQDVDAALDALAGTAGPA